MHLSRCSSPWQTPCSSAFSASNDQRPTTNDVRTCTLACKRDRLRKMPNAAAGRRLRAGQRDRATLLALTRHQRKCITTLRAP
ncbi:hypothetical protein EYC54_20630 [Xanthomonas oryzae]|nr:hypothetical protein EYC54_20630 [Xanthomonas oryzae]